MTFRGHPDIVCWENRAAIHVSRGKCELHPNLVYRLFKADYIQFTALTVANV